MDEGFFSAMLNCVGSFQYWPEVLAVIGSVIVAWLTAWRTSRSEVLKSFRSKRMETYEAVLDLFTKVSRDAEIIFSDEYIEEVVALELRVKSFGSKRVRSSFAKAVGNLDSRRSNFLNKEAELESIYMPEEPIYDEDGALIGEMRHLTIDINEYEWMIENERVKRTPSKRELNDLFAPIVDAIRDSSLRAKD